MACAVLLLSPVSSITLSPILCRACTATGASGLIVSAITRAPSRVPTRRNRTVKRDLLYEHFVSSQWKGSTHPCIPVKWTREWSHYPIDQWLSLHWWGEVGSLWSVKKCRGTTSMGYCMATILCFGKPFNCALIATCSNSMYCSSCLMYNYSHLIGCKLCTTLSPTWIGFWNYFPTIHGCQNHRLSMFLKVPDLLFNLSRHCHTIQRHPLPITQQNLPRQGDIICYQ